MKDIKFQILAINQVPIITHIIKLHLLKMSKRKRNLKCSPDKKAHRIKDNVRMMASVS